MYESFYNLAGPPFRITPEPDLFFPGQSHRKAMAYLSYGLAQGEGFVVITGEIGAGKTTMLAHMVSQLEGEYATLQMITSSLGPEDTLRGIAARLNLPHEGVSKATLTARIGDRLAAIRHMGKRVLLVVDEVQAMPLASLEELRLLSNLQMGKKPLMQICLLGQPEFRSELAKPQLEQLRQRVVSHYHLGPLQPEETRAYVEHRLRAVGWKGDPSLSDEVFAALHQASRGIPRRINVLADRLLVLGAIDAKHSLGVQDFEEVLRTVPEEPMPQAEAQPRPTSGGTDAIGQRLDAIEALIARQARLLQRGLSVAFAGSQVPTSSEAKLRVRGN